MACYQKTTQEKPVSRGYITPSNAAQKFLEQISEPGLKIYAKHNWLYDTHISRINTPRLHAAESSMSCLFILKGLNGCEKFLMSHGEVATVGQVTDWQQSVAILSFGDINPFSGPPKYDPFREIPPSSLNDRFMLGNFLHLNHLHLSWSKTTFMPTYVPEYVSALIATWMSLTTTSRSHSQRSLTVPVTLRCPSIPQIRWNR